MYTDLDFVDVISLQHLPEVLIEILLCDSVLFSPCKKTILLDLGSGDNLKLVTQSLQVLDDCHMSVGNHSAADDGNSKFFHDHFLSV